MPLNNLKAIQANQSAQLELAFRSLQSAVGGKGALRTDFDQLANAVVSLERQYMLGANLKEMLALLGGDAEKLIQHCEAQPKGSKTTVLQIGFTETSVIQKLKQFEAEALSGYIQVKVEKPGITFGSMGAVNGAEISITLAVPLVLEFKDELRR